MVSRAHVWVGGRVHGVFFRHSAKDRALSEGVYGWVRNTDDGRVEAVFEGDPVAIKRVLEWCRKGPEGAVVDDVEVKWDEEPELLSGFYVRH